MLLGTVRTFISYTPSTGWLVVRILNCSVSPYDDGYLLDLQYKL